MTQHFNIIPPDFMALKTFLDLSKLPPPVSHSERITPIPHDFFAQQVLDAIFAEGLHTREVNYYLSEDAQRFFGVFEIVSVVRNPEQSWILAAANANDGTGGVCVYAGLRVYPVNTISFHEELCPVHRHTEKSMTELPITVAAAVKKLHEHWNVNDERAEAYKKLSLTIEQAQSLMCDAIFGGVLAGREIASLLALWRNPASYVKPRNLWSLYCCFNQILNKLKWPQMLERTMMLHRLLDEHAKFESLPSKYTQVTMPLS